MNNTIYCPHCSNVIKVEYGLSSLFFYTLSCPKCNKLYSARIELSKDVLK